MDLERTPLNSLDEGKKRKAQKGAKRAKKGAKRKGRKWSTSERIVRSRKMRAKGNTLSLIQKRPGVRRQSRFTRRDHQRRNVVQTLGGRVQNRAMAKITNRKKGLLQKKARTGSWSRRRADAPDFATRVEMYEELVNYLQECRANS